MIDIRDAGYPILIGDGALPAAAPELRAMSRNGRLFIVTDANIAALHLPALAAQMDGIQLRPVIVPPGETSKSWTNLAEVCEHLLAGGIERGEPVIAFGGGVIGDLGGLAAALIKRGCPVVQIPTTLLAMVDSSVGGKTAINARAGKNLVGLFHPPARVIIDPALLTTLSLRQRRAGYAEMVKYGLIDDAGFFAWCEAHSAAVIAGDSDALAHGIETAIRAKARIVAADPLEHGVRALLNLGHSFGHALEAEAGFSDRLLHGEAVACGMAMAFRFSAVMGHCGQSEADTVGHHIAASQLPSTVGETGLDVTACALLKHMRQDKKNAGGKVKLILARGIGEAFIADDIDEGALLSFLEAETR